jgi:crotonobetainyl-CoA:carnitine CoA-transferase CaiB-like acyl-CoA transferase
MSHDERGTENRRVKPLEGLTVVDLTIALAGPYATFLLAGLGARVIKVENPRQGDPCRTNAPYVGRDGVTLARKHDDDVSASALNRLRGKLGTTLNLKHLKAREIFGDFVRQADVLVENFSTGTLDRLGVGYEWARQVNPRIVFCSLSGFGADKALAGGKAMDTIVQALSGLMLSSGEPDDGPVRVGVPVGDMVAPLFGVIGVLAALQQRERTGAGQFVDVSMLGALTSMVACEPFDLLEQCGVPQRTGRMVPRLAPFGVYRSLDGWVAICAPTEPFARGLFTAMSRLDLATDPRFATRDARVAHVGELNGLIEAFTAGHRTADLIERFDRCGVPAAEVRSPHDGVRDPRVLRRGETLPLAHPVHGQVEDMVGMGVPIVFSEATTGFDRLAPDLGQHNDLVYGDLLGYSPETIAALRADGVI